MDLAEGFASTVPEMASFDREIAKKSWIQFINMGAGKILILDDYSGMLAYMIHPDPYTGELTATEMAWFVDPNKRGRGLLLLIEFEKWAKAWECKRVVMTLLHTEQSEMLSKLYVRRGYVSRETNYIKDI